MKKLKSVKFTQIKPTESYLYSVESYERYGGGDTESYVATGEEIVKQLHEIFFYEEWKEDLPKREITLKKFLEHCWDANGDGVEYIQVHTLPVSK